MELPSGFVIGPGGMYTREAVQALEKDERIHLEDDGGVFKVSRRGKAEQLKPVSPPSSLVRTGPGWVAFAQWARSDGTDPVNRLAATWKAPEPPQVEDGQVIFLLIGVQGKLEGQTFFATPVLQWGKTPFGGGSFWSVACWVQAGTRLFVSGRERVETGQIVAAEVVRENFEGNELWTATAAVNGKAVSITTSHREQEVVESLFGGVLEAYAQNLTCGGYPACAGILFGDLQVSSASGPLTPVWQPTTPVTDCGQQVRVMDPARVEIFFRTPTQSESASSA